LVWTGHFYEDLLQKNTNDWLSVLYDYKSS
jgi:hypothetical protein